MSVVGKKNGKCSSAYNDKNYASQSWVPVTPEGKASQIGCEWKGGWMFKMKKESVGG